MDTLAVVVASTRPGRLGPAIADWFLARAQAREDFAVKLVDLCDVALPLLDEPGHPVSGRYVHQHTKRWAATVDAADAFVFVTPEYNYGVPAPLKNAVDFLFWEWAYKPVGFVSYGMTSAGLNAVAMLRQIVTPLKMVPVNPGVAIPLRDRIDRAGRLDGRHRRRDARRAQPVQPSTAAFAPPRRRGPGTGLRGLPQRAGPRCAFIETAVQSPAAALRHCEPRRQGRRRSPRTSSPAAGRVDGGEDCDECEQADGEQGHGGCRQPSVVRVLSTGVR